MALFFLLATAMFPLLLPTSQGFTGFFGGSKGNNGNNGASRSELALLYSIPNPAGSFKRGNSSGQISNNGGYLLSDSTKGPNLNPTSSGYIEYTVVKGDNLSKIAENFGISIETISSANPKVRGGAIKIGEKLKILPVSGFVYLVKDGETAESIASANGLSISQLFELNQGVSMATLGVGSSLIIPGSQRNLDDYSLPEMKSFFKLPAEGLNWGQIHNHNAIDIANVCGADVFASADGLVTEIGTPEDNNGGYGGYVSIEHSNGTKTKYAHLGGINISLGEYVKQGEKIGEMGNTGTVHGPTGCHLHFEVYGAQNPLRKS